MKNESVDISVIVPVYNSKEYLQRCVESILNQSLQNFELILIDDGSTDGSGELCESFVSLSDSVTIRVIHQENQGQSVARNHGARIAKGQWICFIDSDDYVSKDYLEILYHTATEYNVDISTCDYIEFEKKVERTDAQNNEMILTTEITDSKICELLSERGIIWCPWAKLIKKSIVLKYPFVVGKYYEDNAVVCKWLYEAKTIANTICQLYYYQVNPEGTTKNGFTVKQLDYLWALEEQIQFYKKVGYCQASIMANEMFFNSFFYIYNKAKENNLSPDSIRKIRRQAWRRLFMGWKDIKNKKIITKQLLVLSFPFIIKNHGV